MSFEQQGKEALTPSGGSASGETTAPSGRCHLEAKDWELGTALVVSRRNRGLQFMGYMSTKFFGSISPSNGLGSSLGSNNGSIVPGRVCIVRALKSSAKP